MVEAYPLYWPEGWKRTKHPESSRFKTGFQQARIELQDEIGRMGGSKLIISTNVPLRNDGMPRASAPEPSDSGVAVYFQRNTKSMVFACDRFRYTRDNIYAVAKTINAMRGIERWGASDMMERAFSGFKALGDGEVFDWKAILVMPRDSLPTAQSIQRAFIELTKTKHPDLGGSTEEFQKIIRARDVGLKAVSNGHGG